MDENLPVLQIVIPLIAAPVCVLLRRRTLVLGFSMAVCWVVFAMAVYLLARVLSDGVISYALGGWAAPWGIEYRVDALSAFVLLFVSGIGAIVLTFAPASLTAEVPRDRHYLFCTAYLLCLTGLLGIAITGDLFNLFVFLEISALSSYALISLGSNRRALTASFQYLVMGTIGATFILIGIGLLYMMTGTLNMADMAVQLGNAVGKRTLLVAFAFLSVGIFLKMALFPLHVWLPNAYAFAPSVVTAFLAATATKVAVYILLRFVFTVFGQVAVFEEGTFHLVLLMLALSGIVIASTVAIFQRNIKRMLAYSSLAQIGYMVLGISFGSLTGLTGGIVHLFNHALIKGGLFLAMGCIALRLGSVDLDDMRGIGRRMPVTMLAWVIGGLGLIGVPATAGFVSKWYLIRAALEQPGWWPVAVLVLFSSLLALIYVWRVVEVAYFKDPPEGKTEVKEAPLSMLVPTCVLIAGTVFFGLYTSLSVGVASDAAQLLLEGAR
ncbi:MAG: monovalent cation/H+ antiporter subunit D family protein [Planctomycetota bacterium]|jgi:multicomponent Na+:H+ antiporter subunit D|nr:monovalent cation/H+ antiporter subunit D family protein [Planctomycetota bacterium]